MADPAATDTTAADTTTTTMTTVSAVPPPPRTFGDWAVDGPAISQWFKDLTAANAQQVETINKLTGGAGDVSPSNLPDPASATVASAQQTANDAYLAALAVAARLGMVGDVTISDAATTGDLVFTTAQTDTSYFVIPAQTAASGTPDAGSLIIGSVAKTTAKATLTVTVAPGVGNSVTYTVMCFRAAAAS